MKKLVLTFILIIISSLAFSQADDNNLDSLIPKNITHDDIIFITSNNQNMQIENEDADIKDFWLTYFNDKENKIYNNINKKHKKPIIVESMVLPMIKPLKMRSHSFRVVKNRVAFSFLRTT